jgi:nucleolar protein 58
MLLLLETAAGFGLFKVNNDKILSDPAKIAEAFSNVNGAAKAVTLQAWKSFKDSKSALESLTALTEGKLDSSLKKFLKKNIVSEGIQEELAVQDKTLAAAIQSKLEIPCVVNSTGLQLWRGIRDQMCNLVEGLTEKEAHTMALGLSHTMNRFKLKFSPEKVDIMIIQAVGLLDDLDKELNNFAMRLREWYGWHFPELTKICGDNMTYARIIKAMGYRTNAKSTDFETVLPDVPEDIIKELKTAAEVSMGVEITSQDLEHIHELCERVIELSEYRASLSDYLKQRMNAIAPNLTHMVGELIGARLISHAGSLLNLAKHPASTVQILGAEKALFRALKMREQTPKYGLIFHASVVGQSQQKYKGKISRVLAAKLSLCARVDALGDQAEPTVAIGHREYVEKKMRQFENEQVHGISKNYSQAGAQKFDRPQSFGGYNANGDSSERPQKKHRMSE